MVPAFCKEAWLRKYCHIKKDWTLNISKVFGQCRLKKLFFFSKNLLEAADMRIVWKHGVPFRPFSISLFVLATVVIGGFSYVYWDDSLIWWERRWPRTSHPPLTSAWGAPFSCPSPYLASLMEQSPWYSRLSSSSPACTISIALLWQARQREPEVCLTPECAVAAASIIQAILIIDCRRMDL